MTEHNEQTARRRLVTNMSLSLWTPDATAPPWHPGSGHAAPAGGEDGRRGQVSGSRCR